MDAISTEPVPLVWNALADAATGGQVATPLDDLESSTGLGSREVDDAIDELSRLGMVTSWTAEGKAVATLTPRSAAELGLKIDRVTGSLVRGLAWIRVRDRRADYELPPKPWNALAVDVLGGDERSSSLDYFPSDCPPPDEFAQVAEWIRANEPPPRKARLSDREIDFLPCPQVILTGSAPWRAGKPGVCPVCEGKPLGSSTYCARCDRWGLDWILDRRRRNEAIEARRVARSKPVPASPSSSRSTGRPASSWLGASTSVTA